MTLKQISNLTGITSKELNEYIREGFIENKINLFNGFSDDDIKRISLVRFLFTVGVKKSDIKEYFYFLEKKDYSSAVKLLRSIREKLLAEIHNQQKQLDLLDCIIRNTKETQFGGMKNETNF